MPAVRRPKPIPKPRIEVSTDTSGHTKQWQNILAMQAVVGDIVSGHNRGWLTGVTRKDITVDLHFKNGLTETVFEDTPLRVFGEIRG